MAWDTTLSKYCSFVWKRNFRVVPSFVEEFKCVKTSLEMTLSQSKDPVVKNTAPTIKTGKKWNS